MATRTNLATNPRGDSGAQEWNDENTTATFESGFDVSGESLPEGITEAFRIHTDGAGTEGSGYVSLPIPVTAGRLYTFSLYGQVNVGSAGFGLQARDDEDQLFDFAGIPQDVTTRVFASFVAGDTAVYELRVTHPQLLITPNEQAWFAAVLAEESGARDPYFDGDSEGASWAGEPHASMSTLLVPGSAPPSIPELLDPGPPAIYGFHLRRHDKFPVGAHVRVWASKDWQTGRGKLGERAVSVATPCNPPPPKRITKSPPSRQPVASGFMGPTGMILALPAGRYCVAADVDGDWRVIQIVIPERGFAGDGTIDASLPATAAQ